MTMQQQPYIELDGVINDYLTESEQSVHKHFKVFHLAFRGFEDLGIDFFYQVRAVKLPINANLTVNLPADYLQWAKVGVLNDRGEIIPLYYNDKLTTYSDLLPSRLEKTQDNSLLGEDGWGINTWYNYWNGNSFVNIYGVPSGSPFVGNFKVDTSQGVIILDENFRYEYLMVEYVTTPTQSEQYYLPVQFREALIAWLWWKDKRAVNVNRGQVGVARDLRIDYYNERRKAIARWKPIRKQEIYQASQEQTRMAIKS
jgi:hypothetical protein